MENPIKMDGLGVPVFSETSMYGDVEIQACDSIDEDVFVLSCCFKTS